MITVIRSDSIIVFTVCFSESLETLSLNHFPLQSTEFPLGGSKDREYHQALNELLTALELSKSPLLLEFVIK